MAKRCYYDVLGVQRSAGETDIKSAFRRLAKECHPDRCSGDPTAETRFIEVNEAYEALRVLQRLVGFVDFYEARFRRGVAATAVGMAFLGETPERGLDVGFARASLHAQDVIVAPFSHHPSGPSRPLAHCGGVQASCWAQVESSF